MAMDDKEIWVVSDTPEIESSPAAKSGVKRSQIDAGIAPLGNFDNTKKAKIEDTLLDKTSTKALPVTKGQKEKDRDGTETSKIQEEAEESMDIGYQTSEDDDDDDLEEELIKADDIKERLKEYLEGITSSGAFAYGQEYKNAPDPGLFIEGYGKIGFPLNSHDLEILVAATSGTKPGSKKPVKALGPSSKRFRQVPAALLDFKNPAWKKFLASVLRTVSEKLGILDSKKGLTVTPLALMLYEKGSSTASFDP